MAEYNRHYHDDPLESGHRPRRHERDSTDRTGDEVRSWFGDDEARPRRSYDDRYRPARLEHWRSYGDAYHDDRGSRWTSPQEDRDRYAAATGTYRSDDRDYHQRYRAERYRDDYRARDASGSYGSGSGAGEYYASGYDGPGGRLRHGSGADAANEYYRAAREQRDDFDRWSGQGAGWQPSRPGWRPSYSGRGPKDYQRSDERVREEISDCMTEDPLLDASDITITVRHGEVTLSGTVFDRDQKRRAEDLAERVSGVKDVSNQLRVSRDANGYGGRSDTQYTSSQPHQGTAPPPADASRKGTPSKSSRNTT